jgi:hypothetical protein
MTVLHLNCPGCLKIESGIRAMMPPRLLRLDAGFSCIEPSLFLKQNIPASGPAMFPKTGHVLNIEEPALFNKTLERFLAWRKRIAGRRAILPRGAPEGGATASVRRVGSIRAVEGRSHDKPARRGCASCGL